jgi:hypothetical protein
MRAGAHKVNPVGINLVNQQKVASDVALTVIGPLPFQAVIQPFAVLLASFFFKVSKQFVSKSKTGATCCHHGARLFYRRAGLRVWLLEFERKGLGGLLVDVIVHPNVEH